MSSNHVNCPTCGETISLDDALSAQMKEKFEKDFRERFQKAGAELKQREEQFILKAKQKEEQLNVRAKQMEMQLAERIAAEKLVLEKRVREQIEKSKTLEFEDLKSQIAEKDKKLDDSVRAQIELRKKARELEEKEKALELNLMNKLDEEKKKLEESIGQRVADDQRLKMAEKEKQLDDMRKQIEDLKRRSELTSQQMQGEVLELQLETELRKLFPIDVIAPVAKGARGGDIVHKVMTPSGHHVGTIVWETKRTKSWSDGWIDKLKEDQRSISAEFAVIVSEVLPKGVHSHALNDGVWVCDMKSAHGLATALRMSLTQVFSAKSAVNGKDEKMEVIYNYLTGTQFTQKIQAVVETFRDMKQELDQEKRAYQKLWKMREEQIEKVIMNTASVYGSIRGIVGGALPKIAALELPGSLALPGEGVGHHG